MTPEQLEEIQGIDPDSVERIQEAVNAYYSQFEEAGRRSCAKKPPPEELRRSRNARGSSAEEARVGSRKRKRAGREAEAAARSEPGRYGSRRAEGGTGELAERVWYDRRRGFPHSQSRPKDRR